MSRSLNQKAFASGCGDQRSAGERVILIYLPGGSSHMDTFDLKPDAPAEFRGEFAVMMTDMPATRVAWRGADAPG